MVTPDREEEKPDSKLTPALALRLRVTVVDSSHNVPFLCWSGISLVISLFLSLTGFVRNQSHIGWVNSKGNAGAGEFSLGPMVRELSQRRSLILPTLSPPFFTG